MKKFCFITATVFTSFIFAQITPSNITIPIQSINMGTGPNKHITWPTSDWDNGFGHRIINDDFDGSTHLFIQSKHNSTNWETSLAINSSGNVGIGTENASFKLDVVGGSTALSKYLNLRDFETGGGGSQIISRDGNTMFWYGGVAVGQYSNNTTDNLNTGELVVKSRLGIGTLDFTQNGGDSKLLVDGKILCEEVEVIQNVAPDYVFQKYYTGISLLKPEYVMPTLEEIEAFTKENHHLPEVPSAAEIKEDGMQLKEMTTLLLQKVEELTLYTIEQEKRIKALEAELAKQ